MDLLQIREIIPLIIPIILAITLHEAAHAFVAYRCGDSTAYMLGRVSLNPSRHIDPIGTILIPILTFATTGFIFGYAKPVPVNFGQLRHYRRDGLFVALAGVGMNFLLALGFAFLGFVLRQTGVTEEFFLKLTNGGVMINLIFAIFNLFPLLPLDGGRAVGLLLPTKWELAFRQIEPYGIWIILGLAMSGILAKIWINPLMQMLTSTIFQPFL